MRLPQPLRRIWSVIYRVLSSGDDERELGAANAGEERARLFKVFTSGGSGGKGGYGGITAPGGEPPHNMRGSRPDRDEV
jgi:hypothetical protein